MTWNYRIIKRKNEKGEYEFAVYEVYYDENGNPISCTEEPLTPTCSSEEDLLYELNIMMQTFKKETLDYDKM